MQVSTETEHEKIGNEVCHNSFRVLLDKIASTYFIWKKYIYILALDMESQGDQHCTSCIGTLSLPIAKYERNEMNLQLMRDLLLTKTKIFSHSIHCRPIVLCNRPISRFTTVCCRYSYLLSQPCAKSRPIQASVDAQVNNYIQPIVKCKVVE